MTREISTIRTATADLNGIARGKRMPIELGEKVETDGVRFPLSVLNLDIFGEDIDGSPLVFESGDPDGIAMPTERGPLPMPWLDTPSALLPMWMYREDGQLFEGDPRHALAHLLVRFSERGMTPIVGIELEFYLVDDSGETIRPAPSQRSGKRRTGGNVLSAAQLDAFDGFFTALYEGAAAMGIPAETAISEGGMGQFEINLGHREALRAADDAWLFKLLTQGIARKHGFAASFMAKPYADQPGNGMHVHVSIIGDAGQNIFDDGTETGSDALRHAIQGCLATMPDAALVFAPHGSSYDRFVPGAHAPTGVGWAYENRTAAIRVPAGNPKARRIEHRVAGGDVNPYLMLTAVLGGIINGVADRIDPPAPLTGNAYEQDVPSIPTKWADAVDQFARSDVMARIFPKVLIENFVATKRQEMAKMAALSGTEQRDIYLDPV